MDIHLIPGLAADHRIFERLLVDVPGRTAHDWPDLPYGSSLRDHALAMARSIDATRPHMIVGMSMGGMVAQELASITKPDQVVIVSSWKGPQEMPAPLRVLRGTHPERVLTPEFLTRIAPMVRWQMGAGSPEEIALLDHFLAITPIDRIKTQIAAVLAWNGPERPVPLLHIHGDSDRLMPIRSIADAVVIPGGTHLMVFSKAAEVEAEIRPLLRPVYR